MNQTYDLIKQIDGTWILKYTVPYIPDGNYTIILKAADIAGNENTFPLIFKVFNPLDNQSPIVSGIVIHTNRLNDLFTEEPRIYFQAFSDPDVISITASLLKWDYNLYRQDDGSWTREGGGWLEQGNYTVVFIAKDWSGNQGTQLINLCVENIIPLITPTLSSTKIRSGDSFVLTVTVNQDPEKVYVSTPSGVLDLQEQLDGSWDLNYTIPTLNDGYKEINIICSYGTGWISLLYTRLNTAQKSIGFIVDNTPPTFSDSVTPNPIKSGDPLKIWVSCTTGSYYVPDDTAHVTVTIFGNTFNLNCLGRGSDWFKSNSFSDWSIEIIVPNIPDGIYPLVITATDDAGNQKTKIINLTVDNTPPTITATIIPDTLKFIDFSTNRVVKITAQSSADTGNIFALIDNSWKKLTCSNDQWALDFIVPHIITTGTHYIQLKAIDYAGNEGNGYVSYNAIVYSTFLTFNNEASEIGSGTNVDSGSGSSSGNSGSGSNGKSSDSSSNSGNPSDGPNQAPTPPDYTWLYIMAIIVAVILILALLYFIGALSIIGLLLSLVFDLFIGILGVLYECMIYVGFYIILNPFAILLDILSVFWAASRSDLLEVILGMIVRWAGIESKHFEPIASAFSDAIAPKTYLDLTTKGSQLINDTIIKPIKSWIWG